MNAPINLVQESRVGMILDEPMDVYHAHPAISPSKLRAFASNYPAYFKARFIDRTIAEADSAAFAFGRYAHSLILENDVSGYAVSPGFDRRTKQGKLEAENFAAANAGKQVVDADDALLAARLQTAVRANPIACDLLAQGAPEVTFRHYRIPHMPLQCRPDWFSAEPCRWSGGYSYVVNFKTIDGMFGNLASQAHKFGYYLAESFARSVISDCRPDGRLTRHFFIVVDKQAPHGCGVFEADEITMDTARRVVTKQLAALRDCIENNEWPSAPVGIEMLSAPEWWNKQNEE